MPYFRYLRTWLLVCSLMFAFIAVQNLNCVLAGSESRGARLQVSSRLAPSPRDIIGFMPGDDRKLASWAQFVDYYRRLAQGSDRVLLEDLGKTTLGRPFLLAVISSPANLARIGRYKEIQARLADPRTTTDDQARSLIGEGKTVVMITFGIHSTEVGSSLSSLNIVYKLASDDSPETREILDNCIVLVVPSLNPDGIDIVKDWYDRTLGTPAEGLGPPELYHHYVGHDNNRDWYAFTQVETQLTIDRIHNVWHPQIVHDVHQQGDNGTRFFVPPYVEPWEPNVPPLIQAGVNFMGTAIAWELISQGKSGVVVNGIYDAWTPARAYQHYHGGIRILSETASARLASPTNIPFGRLRPQVNVDTKVRSWNYPVVWPGGDWRLSDIVEYMESGAFALMRNAARYRDRWLRDFYQIGKDAVRERKAGEPFAFLILEPKADEPASRWRKNGLGRLLTILARGGVEVLRAGVDFEAGGASYPAGTFIVPMSQPYGAFARTLLERQRYPDLREYPGGPPRRPYDVTAHTLPLLMGVNAVQVDRAFEIPRGENGATGSSGLETAVGPLHDSIAPPRVGLYKSYSASMDEGWTRWIFDTYKLKYSTLLDKDLRAGGLKAKLDCIVIPDQSTQQIVEGLSRERYPGTVSGGLGKEGIEALKQFVADGGTLITLNNASGFAIAHLGVPVKNALENVSNRDFFCPGSILRITLDPQSPLARGVPSLGPDRFDSMAWFERGAALEPTGNEARIVARFANADQLLLSGWLLGAEKIAGSGAIVEATHGRGRVIMFAFKPQYRGQSVATLPLLFNAIAASVQDSK